MTRAEFQDLLDTFGAKPSGWPEADKMRALRLMDGDPKAMALFEECLAMEDALVSEPVPAPRPDAVADVLRQVAIHAEFEAEQNAAVPGTHAGPVFLNAVKDALSELRRMLTRPELTFGACTAAGVFLGLYDGLTQTEQPVDLVLAYIVAVFPL